MHDTELYQKRGTTEDRGVKVTKPDKRLTFTDFDQRQKHTQYKSKYRRHGRYF